MAFLTSKTWEGTRHHQEPLVRAGEIWGGSKNFLTKTGTREKCRGLPFRQSWTEVISLTLLCPSLRPEDLGTCF